MKRLEVYSLQLTVDSDRRRLLLLIMLNCLLITACIPARTPENLANTPGAPAVITDDEYQGAAFRVRYPAGWRAIKGAATDPESVVFADSANCQLIGVYVGRAPALSIDTGCGAAAQLEQTVTLDDTLISVAGAAPESAWDAFQPIFERVAESVR